MTCGSFGSSLNYAKWLSRSGFTRRFVSGGLPTKPAVRMPTTGAAPTPCANSIHRDPFPLCWNTISCALYGVMVLKLPVAEVQFDEPQMSVTPGQTAVFYDADSVVGSGIIQ